VVGEEQGPYPYYSLRRSKYILFTTSEFNVYYVNLFTFVLRHWRYDVRLRQLVSELSDVAHPAI
jgi:hypothetical protein